MHTVRYSPDALLDDSTYMQNHYDSKSKTLYKIPESSVLYPIALKIESEVQRLRSSVRSLTEMCIYYQGRSSAGFWFNYGHVCFYQVSRVERGGINICLTVYSSQNNLDLKMEECQTHEHREMNAYMLRSAIKKMMQDELKKVSKKRKLNNDEDSEDDYSDESDEADNELIVKRPERVMGKINKKEGFIEVSKFEITNIDYTISHKKKNVAFVVNAITHVPKDKVNISLYNKGINYDSKQYDHLQKIKVIDRGYEAGDESAVDICHKVSISVEGCYNLRALKQSLSGKNSTLQMATMTQSVFAKIWMKQDFNVESWTFPDTIFGFEQHDKKVMSVFTNCVIFEGLIKTHEHFKITINRSHLPESCEISRFFSKFPTLSFLKVEEGDSLADIREYCKIAMKHIKKVFNKNYAYAMYMVGFSLAAVNFHRYNEFPCIVVYSPNGNCGKSSATRLVSAIQGYNGINLSSKETEASLKTKISLMKNAIYIVDDYAARKDEFMTLCKRMYTKDDSDDFNKTCQINGALMVSTNQLLGDDFDTVERRIFRCNFNGDLDFVTTDEFKEYECATKDLSCVLQLVLKIDYKNDLCIRTEEMCDAYIVKILGHPSGADTPASKNSKPMFFYMMFFAVLCECPQSGIEDWMRLLVNHYKGFGLYEIPSVKTIYENMEKLIESL